MLVAYLIVAFIVFLGSNAFFKHRNGAADYSYAWMLALFWPICLAVLLFVIVAAAVQAVVKIVSEKTED